LKETISRQDKQMTPFNLCRLKLGRFFSGQLVFMAKMKRATPVVPTAAAGWFGWEAVLVARHVVTRVAADRWQSHFYLWVEKLIGILETHRSVSSCVWLAKRVN
jgi:hypothetical protein